MNEKFSKGIFWFICAFDEMERCDFSETEMIAFPIPCDRDGNATDGLGFIANDKNIGVSYNSKKGNALNHKATWESLVKHHKDMRSYKWNYFPRGRVEISKGRAFIYLNINIIRYEDFWQDIVNTFHLEGLDVRVIVDNSAHYYCHEDAQHILGNYQRRTGGI